MDRVIKFIVIFKEGKISSLKEWLNDSAIGSNPVLRLIAGNIVMDEQDHMRCSSRGMDMVALFFISTVVSI